MYHQLKQLIANDIVERGMKPGELLPGEHGLCEQFGVSRTVVRQALALLEQQGVIERVKGKGTFVAHKKTAESLVHTLKGLFEEVEERGGHVRSEVRQLAVVPAEGEIADSLAVAEGTDVVVLERLRFVNEEPWSWSTTYLPLPVGESILTEDLRDRSLYGLLAERGIRAVRGIRSAEASSATEEQSKLLDVRVGHALLVLRSVGYDENDRPMEFFVAYHRGDRSRFEFHLAANASERNHAALHHVDGFQPLPPAL